MYTWLVIRLSFYLVWNNFLFLDFQYHVMWFPGLPYTQSSVTCFSSDFFLPISLTDFLPFLEFSLACGMSVHGHSVLFPLPINCKSVYTCQNMIHFLYHQKQGKYLWFILFLQDLIQSDVCFWKLKFLESFSVFFPLMNILNFPNSCLFHSILQGVVKVTISMKRCWV